jgi:Fe-S cluster assembly protein SufD
LASAVELPNFKGRPGWEFTDLSGLDLDAYPPAEDDGHEIDGVEPLLELSGAADPGDAVVGPLDEAPEAVKRHLGTVVSSEDPFVAANEAGQTNGTFVYVPKGAIVDLPILLTAVQAQPKHSLNWRTLIVIEEQAEAEVWEQYLSADEDMDALFNVVTEVVVGPGARLRYVSGQGLSESSWIFGTQRAVVERDGSFEWVALGFGSAKGKVRMETNLAGPGADAKVTGAYAGRGRQHLDFDTTQEHAAPNTVSDLAFRGVLDDRSTAVWRGMIKVDPGAQQTDAFQESRNLLLSKRAHADAIPGLEIEANDVRCTHAAAIAQIDKEQLFYLKSHGIPHEQSTRLVIEGFLQELVERFPAEGHVHDALSRALERRLETILGAP